MGVQMSCGPHQALSTISMLVPPVFRVLVKMNPCLREAIMESCAAEMLNRSVALVTGPLLVASHDQRAHRTLSRANAQQRQSSRVCLAAFTAAPRRFRCMLTENSATDLIGETTVRPSLQSSRLTFAYHVLLGELAISVSQAGCSKSCQTSAVNLPGRSPRQLRHRVERLGNHIRWDALAAETGDGRAPEGSAARAARCSRDNALG